MIANDAVAQPGTPRQARSRTARGTSAHAFPHLGGLDGLRGLAVLAVVLFHFAPGIAPGGFLGVDVFFVLSGFLITSLLVAELERRNGIGLRAFWLRRARRLLPALFLVLSAVAIYALTSAGPLEVVGLRNDGLSSLGYFANWHLIASSQSYLAQFVHVAPSPLRHMWSLAIEEQFYLVWPLVVAGLGAVLVTSTKRFRHVLAVGSVAFAALSLVAMGTLYHGGDPSRVYYGTDTHGHQLLLGAALGALSAGNLPLRSRRASRGAVWLGTFAALALGALFFTVEDNSGWLYKGGYAVIGMLVAAVIVGAGQPGGYPLARGLQAIPLRFLGLISYGVYLWHWPIFVWVNEQSTGIDGVPLFALRVALTLLVSVASYTLVEMPVRRGALRHIGPRLVWLATLAVVAAIAAAFVAAPLLTTSDPSPAAAVPSARTTDAVSAAYAKVERCDNPKPAPTPRANVLLVGNSVAVEVQDCLATVLAGHGYQLEHLTENGAGLCDLLPRLRSRLAQSDHPMFVVLYTLAASVTKCWLRNGQSPAEIQRTWMDDVKRSVDVATAAGAHVFLVPSAPAAGQRGEDPLAPRFRALAKRIPNDVTLVDAHSFVRDTNGVYQWSMPCIPAEAGCENGLVGIRLTGDHGIHFCTDLTWNGGYCAPKFAAGERREASGLALGLVPELDAQSSATQRHAGL